jgi:ABC-2 type transport system permease protein
MSPLRVTLEVARWEFLRFFKPKQLAAGMLITLLAGGAGWGIARAGRTGVEPVRIAVAGGEGLLLGRPDGSRLHLVAHAVEEVPALRGAVERGDLAGLVLWRAAAPPLLVTGERPRWRAELERALSAAALPARFAAEGVAPERLPVLLAPIGLEVEYANEAARPRSRGETVVLVAAVLLLMLCVVTGMGFLFASISGEKQNRVTEQVVAAIAPQRWMDGKILGVAAVTLVNVAATALSFAAVLVFAVSVLGIPAPPLPRSLGSPAVLLVVGVMTLLGFAFWFSFLAMVAAIIDDPNHSGRGGLLMLPMLGAGSAFLVFGDSGGLAVRLLSVLPPTSATVLPARMLVATVPAWEAALAALLLAASAVALRRAAGRVFRLGMLMYGKEPTWAEVRRWIGET